MLALQSNKVSFFVHALLEHANKVRQEVGEWRGCWCSKRWMKLGDILLSRTVSTRMSHFFQGILIDLNFPLLLGRASLYENVAQCNLRKTSLSF